MKRGTYCYNATSTNDQYFSFVPMVGISSTGYFSDHGYVSAYMYKYLSTDGIPLVRIPHTGRCSLTTVSRDTISPVLMTQTHTLGGGGGAVETSGQWTVDG